MIKRTLYFGNPAYLRFSNEQLLIENEVGEQKVPVEDIGLIILDHPQITLTQTILTKLIENNAAIINCNAAHHPIGLFLPLDTHTLQSERFRDQIRASEPLKKQLWQQTVRQKVLNQAGILLDRKIDSESLKYLAKEVRSGDPDNIEARAAAYYWKHLFGDEFLRERFGKHPNHLLNYGYAILRAIVARSLVGSGLLPTLGIHHHNKYNAYCLADDIMEPYRPYVDGLVDGLTRKHPGKELELTKETKAELLQIPVLDVYLDGKKSPLMVATQLTTASLASCYQGESKKLKYPNLL